MKPLPKAKVRILMKLLTLPEEIRTMTTSKAIDPARVLQEAFPRKLVEDLAAECGVVQRERVFRSFEFFWALVSTTLAGASKSIAAVKIEYERLAGTQIAKTSFYQQFDAPMVEFLRLLFAHACEVVFPQTGMPEVLRRFNQALIQDSTVLRLRNAMASRWPGAGTKAAAKLNVVLCANGGGANRIQITKGTRSEVKLATINSRLKDALVIFDLGYQKLANFARIEHNGGYFLTRLKDNVHPTIAESNLTHRGASIPLAGQALRDVLPYLRRSVLDVTIDVTVSRKGQPGPVPLFGHQKEIRCWRVVGLRNEKTGDYHLYLTNVPADWLSAEEVGAAYACRWEIERLFAEFKGPYDLGAWKVTKEETMLAHVYGVLIAWAVSRRLRSAVVGIDERTDALAAALAAPTQRWAHALLHHIRDLAKAVVRQRAAPRHLPALLRHASRDPNRGRIPLAARTKPTRRNAPAAPAVA